MPLNELSDIHVVDNKALPPSLVPKLAEIPLPTTVTELPPVDAKFTVTNELTPAPSRSIDSADDVVPVVNLNVVTVMRS